MVLRRGLVISQVPFRSRYHLAAERGTSLDRAFLCASCVPTPPKAAEVAAPDKIYDTRNSMKSIDLIDVIDLRVRPREAVGKDS